MKEQIVRTVRKQGRSLITTTVKWDLALHLVFKEQEKVVSMGPAVCGLYSGAEWSDLMGKPSPMLVLWTNCTLQGACGSQKYVG